MSLATSIRKAIITAMTMEETIAFDDVTVKIETEKALLCIINEEEYWIPKSCISEDSEVYGKDTEGRLVISEWIAKQKNLI